MTGASFVGTRPASMQAALAKHWRLHMERERRQAQQPAAATAGSAVQTCDEPAGSVNSGESSDDSSAGSMVADWLEDVGSSSDEDSVGVGVGVGGGGEAPRGPPPGPLHALPAGMEPAVELAQRFVALHHRPPQILDIGCGDGALLAAMHESAVSVASL